MKTIINNTKKKLSQLSDKEVRNISFMINIFLFIVAFLSLISTCSRKTENHPPDLIPEIIVGNPLISFDRGKTWNTESTLTDSLTLLYNLISNEFSLEKLKYHNQIEQNNQSELLVKQKKIISNLSDCYIKYPFEIIISNNGGTDATLVDLNFNIDLEDIRSNLLILKNYDFKYKLREYIKVGQVVNLPISDSIIVTRTSYLRYRYFLTLTNSLALQENQILEDYLKMQNQLDSLPYKLFDYKQTFIDVNNPTLNSTLNSIFNQSVSMQYELLCIDNFNKRHKKEDKIIFYESKK